MRRTHQGGSVGADLQGGCGGVGANINVGADLNCKFVECVARGVSHPLDDAHIPHCTAI